MTKTKPTKPLYDQDQFDRGFIRALHALQEIGFAKNVLALEAHLEIPARTLYQVLHGRRGVPAAHRFKIQRLFADLYRVNPKVFSNQYAQMWKDEEPPSLNEIQEPFIDYKTEKKGNTLSMGDLRKIDRLEAENAALQLRVKELTRQNRELTKQLAEASRTLRTYVNKTGQKSGQKR